MAPLRRVGPGTGLPARVRPLPSPRWSASSATSTSPRRRSRRRSWSPRNGGRTSGLPPNPGAWITTTARNRAIDRLRREASRHDRHAQAALLHERDEPPEAVGPVKDDRLRLIFTCCHPALATERPGRPDAAAARRPGDRRDRPGLPRARGDDGAATGAGQAQDPRRQHPLPRSPATPSCPTACAPCSPSSTWSSTRATPRPRATTSSATSCAPRPIRLARLLAELMPDEPEVLGLLAPAAADRVPPRRPDRRRRLARAAPRPGPQPVGPGPHRRGPGHRAGLPAPEHARAVPDPGGDQRRAQRRRRRPPTPTGARSSRSTTSCWRCTPTPVVALNRAVALAEVDGPGVALAAVDELDLDAYGPFHITRADLLARLGQARGGGRGLRPCARAHGQRGRAPVPPRAPQGARSPDRPHGQGRKQRPVARPSAARMSACRSLPRRTASTATWPPGGPSSRRPRSTRRRRRLRPPCWPRRRSRCGRCWSWAAAAATTPCI